MATTTQVPPIVARPMSSPVPSRLAATTKRALLYVTLSLASFLFLLPVLWMLFASVKPEGTIISNPSQLFPTHFTSQNYSDALHAIPFARQFFNTVIFAGSVTIMSLLFDSMTAYALARLEFPGKRLLFLLVLLFLMMPTQITLIPVYQLLAHLGLINTFPGLIIPRATNAFGIFFLRQCFIGIPKDLSEAARIDGAHEFRIYWSVVMPLAGPALLTLGLFHFMFNWNDLLWPLIISTSTDMATLPAGLALFSGQHVVQYGLVMTGSTMAMLPMLLAFLLVQRKFIQGIATTGFK